MANLPGDWASAEEVERWKSKRTAYVGKRHKKKRNRANKASRAQKKRVVRVSKISPFFASKEWKALRYEAIKKHGARCQCCGAGPADGATINVDHIKPRYKFPELALDIENLQVLCSWCNQGKGHIDTTDWRSPKRSAA